MGKNDLTLEQEQDLVARALDGDGEAFGGIYDAYKRVLYTTVIYPRLNNQQASEEVLQETFLLALKKLGDFKWQDRSILFWLRIIAVNKVHERLNLEKRAPTVDESVLEYQHDNTWQPEEKAMTKEYVMELRVKIREALGDLNERYRTAIEMRLARKLTREQCAQELGVSMETFDVLFFRACKSFRERYIKKYGDFVGLGL
jgi:RNA polymerase sigma-70 factor, ECF subfamily